MRKDEGDGGWFFDGRDQLQLATTVRALFDVDAEHALQQLRPPNAPLCAPGWPGRAVGTDTTALRSFAFGASTP